MSLITFGSLLAGLCLLIVGGETVVRGAASVGMRLGMSALATGLTVVAFGTSAPELVVNLQAASRDVGDMAVGNVVGSNIANIGLVLGLSVIVKPISIDLRVIRNDIYVMIAVGLLAAVFLALGPMTQWEGTILVVLVFLYTAYNLWAAKAEKGLHKDPFEAALVQKEHSVARDIVFLVGGLAALAYGGNLFVVGAVDLASAFGVSHALIGLTVVAIGTSLPELATTAIAAYRGHGDMAIGNIVGSNIFNVLSVLGFTSLVYPIERGDVGNIDLLMFLVSTLVMFRFIQTGSRMDRWEGGVLFAGFCAYLLWRVTG